MDTSPEVKAVNKFPIQQVSKFPLAKRSDINQLEIADGLKQLLLSRDCDLNFLLQANAASLAQQLGIDEYVASPIIKAAKAMNDSNS